jgi:hypothetical protein
MGIRAWFNWWLERRLHAENARLSARADCLYAELEARGEKLSMTDANYGELKRAEEAGGPVAVERFKRISHWAGRE